MTDVNNIHSEEVMNPRKDAGGPNWQWDVGKVKYVGRSGGSHGNSLKLRYVCGLHLPHPSSFP